MREADVRQRQRSLRVVIAPDSFKGSINAAGAAAAIAEGWATVRPQDQIITCPQADGGEGTIDVIAASSSSGRLHEVEVAGPDGRTVGASWLELPGALAVVELAQSSGLALMAQPDSLRASTYGLGEVLRAVLEASMHSITVCLGGSASSDGGAGALQALGLSLLDSRGVELGLGGAALADLARIEPLNLIPPPLGGVTLLTDVTNPLLGPRGAVATFGRQKGAAELELDALERGLSVFARFSGGDPEAPGMGAAGGTAFGLTRFWGGQVVSGSSAIASLTGLDRIVDSADVVVLGEGRFDQSSHDGKVVGNALSLATDTVSYVVAGSVDAAASAALPSTRFIALEDLAGSTGAAQKNPDRWLVRAGIEAATAMAG